ncbi:MAG: type III pantothenate kinase, partial [Deltaproteobacteria bacterium]|nr:type III pantothenate kinase [Deltaproteobacteria bacterium]
MLLAVDIGNTNIVFGVFDGATLLTHFRIETRKARTEDEYAALLHSMFTLSGLPFRAGPQRDTPLEEPRPTDSNGQGTDGQLRTLSAEPGERGITAGILATVVPPVLTAFQRLFRR